MAVPSSGEISFNDINIVAGKPSGSEVNFGELGLGAGFVEEDLNMGRFHGWFPNLIATGSYLTAQSPAYSNDCGRTWKEFDMTGWSAFRLSGTGFSDTHGQGTRDGETYGFTGQSVNNVSLTGTRRTFISRDHGITYEHKDVSANAYVIVFPEDPSTSSYIGNGYAWNYNKGRSLDDSSTWVTTTNTTVMAPAISCSSSGQYVYGCGHNGWCKRSSDYGATWNEFLSSFGAAGFATCDDSGQNLIAFVTSATGRFAISTNYASSWSTVVSNAWCHGYISPDGNFMVYTNGTAHTLNYSTNQGYSWTSIDISTEFPNTERVWCYGNGSNDTVFISPYNQSSTKVYYYTKGDSGITEAYDYSSELSGKFIYRSIPSKFKADGQQMLLTRDMSGNLYHIPDVFGTPVATKIWDADVKEGDQTTFFFQY